MSMPPQDSAAGRIKLGWEDFLELPDDGNRYEILDGDLVMTPTPAVLHQIVSKNLFIALHEHVSARGLGTVLYAPVAIRLDDSNIAEPDLIYLASDRADKIEEQAIVVAPNLLVEILSPSTAKRDRTIKAHIYARLGVEHYWLVDPKERRLEAMELCDDAYARKTTRVRDEAFEPSLFPGLRIELVGLWD